jgi:hypothetical protein
MLAATRKRETKLRPVMVLSNGGVIILCKQCASHFCSIPDRGGSVASDTIPVRCSVPIGCSHRSTTFPGCWLEATLTPLVLQKADLNRRSVSFKRTSLCLSQSLLPASVTRTTEKLLQERLQIYKSVAFSIHRVVEKPTHLSDKTPPRPSYPTPDPAPLWR